MAFPENTANLQLWLDANEDVLSAIGPDVAAVEFDGARQWNDQSGNSRHFGQSTSSSRPLWGQSLANGQPGLLFDGSSHVLTSSATLANVITASTFEMLLAFRVEVSNVSNANVWLNDAIICDESGYWGLFARSTGVVYGFTWDGASKSIGLNFTPGTLHVISLRHASGNLVMSINGGSESTVACGNTTTLTGALAIGNRASVGAKLRGHVAEVLIWNVALTSQQRSDNIAYLISKYTPTKTGYNWTPQLVLSGGRLDSIADLGGGNLLAASRSPTPAKVYGSSDSGASWSLYETVGTADLNTIAEDQTNAGTAYMVDENSKVYKTTNYGDTWSDLGQISTATPVGGFARCYGLIVTSTGTILVADMANAGGHIFRSTNGGSSFTDLGAIATGGIYRFCLVGDGILCNSTSGRIYRSTDDGATWANMGQLVADKLWAIVYLGNGVVLTASDGGKIFRSTDNGQNWTEVATLSGGADDFAHYGDSVMYSTYTTPKRHYRSDDAGLTWRLNGHAPTTEDDSIEHLIPLGRRLLGVTNKGYVIRSNEAVMNRRRRILFSTAS